MRHPVARLPCLAAAAAVLGCSPAVQPRTSAAAAEGGTGDAVAAARAFVGTLGAAGRDAALFPFGSDERIKWFFVPIERVGLPLKRMEPAQRDAAWALLDTGLSDEGMRLARQIVEHELILRELELAAGQTNAVTRRDPELYYVSIFGDPQAEEPWGWRFEGHHLSINLTDTGGGGQVVTPLFMGANPARVPSGPRAGFRLLAREEDMGRELLAMLTPAQRARATLADTTFGEVVTRNDPVARPVALEGLPASEMTPAQQAHLRRLLELHSARMPPEAARAQWERIEHAGFGRLHFAWAGTDQIGKAHYYRIHGPTLLVEYDNSQNDANHVHTVWRDLQNDFGGDLLRAHYRRHPHN